MRSLVAIRHVSANGGERVLFSVTSIELHEDLLDPVSTLDVEFDPLPSDVAEYRQLIQRGELLRFYIDSALQSAYLIESVTTTVSRSGGVHISAHCVHPIKVLTEAQLDSSYEKLFKSTSKATLGDLMVNVAQKFFFNAAETESAAAGSQTVKIRGLPVFEPNDGAEGWQRINKSPPQNDPTSTKWRSINITEARAQNNETAYEFLARQATRYGLIIRPAANGAMMLTRPLDKGNPDYVLGTGDVSHVGQNRAITGVFLDSLEETSSNAGQPSDIIVKGQTTVQTANTTAAKNSTAITLATSVRKVPPIDAKAEDLGLPARSVYRHGTWYPYKPVYAFDKNAPDARRCKNTARLIAGLRAREAYKLNVKLDGSGDTQGTLYGVNRLATVIIPQLGINGETFLIVRRNLSIDASQGQVTSLELVPKGALIIGEEPGS